MIKKLSTKYFQHKLKHLTIHKTYNFVFKTYGLIDKKDFVCNDIISGVTVWTSSQVKGF